jgi:short-subunit dehydrogenase
MKPKTALVIGASRGIGASVAKTLSKNYSLFLASKTLPDLESLAKTLGNAVPIRCDVRCPADVVSMIKALDGVAPDLVVYNAGAIFHGSWTETSVKKYKLLHEVYIFRL